MASLRMPR